MAQLLDCKILNVTVVMVIIIVVAVAAAVVVVLVCQKFDETINYIIPACPILAREQYIKRHDRMCIQLHLNICKETGIKLDKKQWYEHVQKSLETSQEGKVTIL